jgi:uncharacterized protein YjbJ (UPF0337 family)
MINKDQNAGAAKTVLGKTQEAAGKAANDKLLQLKGLKNQTKGSLQARQGDAIEALDDVAKAVKSEVGGP